MRRSRLIPVLVVLAVLVAGCTFPGTGGSSAGDGDDSAVGSAPSTDGGGDSAVSADDDGGDPSDRTTGDASDGAGETATNPATATEPLRTVADDHPYVADGTLDVRALVVAHTDALGRAGSLALTNNGTVRYAANGSLSARITDVRRFDFDARRLSILRRSAAPDGETLGESGQFANATTTCTLFEGEVQCAAGGFDRRQALGLTMETTSLETVAGPAFAPNGTVERDGRSLYRYTATSLRPSLGESVRSELGPNPSLRRATLLVAPGGRIVEYRFTLERDDGSGETAERVVLQRTYRTSAVNATTVSRPGWFQE